MREEYRSSYEHREGQAIADPAVIEAGRGRCIEGGRYAYCVRCGLHR